MKKMILKTKSTLIASAISAVVLTGCGGGGGGTSDYSPPPSNSASAPQQLNGSGVKGPLANANVAIYALDAAQPGQKGALLASGTTDSTAAISGVMLPDSVTGAAGFLEQLFIIEISGGQEVGSNLAPVISNLRGVITGLDYSRDRPAYMTPLTTLALDLAAKLKQQNPTIEFADLLNGNGLEIGGVVALNAEQTVKAAFGLDLIDNVNLFSDAPLLKAGGDTQKTLNYRIALETMAAIVESLQAAGGADTNDLLTNLADDLSDGSIDGNGSGGDIAQLSSIANLLALVTADPDDLFIPNTAPPKPISELDDVILDEAAMTSPGLNVAALPVPVVGDLNKPLASTQDGDGDGVPDSVDVFPLNRFESADTDGDCAPIPAMQDGKTGKGCGDNSDWAPNDAMVKSYCDAGSLDGGDTGNVVDNATKTAAGCFDDDDLDGVVNYDDLFINNIAEWEDTDNDCSGDNSLATSGNGCGDNSDFDVCYNIFINGRVQLVDGFPDATTAHGVGKGWLDTSTGILKAAIIQRAEIRDPFGALLPSGKYPVLADGIIRTDYNVDINDLEGAQSIKHQRGCVNIAPADKVNACVVLATGDTYEQDSQVGVAAGSYSIANDFSEVRFDTTFTLLANVLSKHLFAEVSREAGGVTACDLTDPPQSVATSIPQTYTLPL